MNWLELAGRGHYIIPHEPQWGNFKRLSFRDKKAGDCGGGTTEQRNYV